MPAVWQDGIAGFGFSRRLGLWWGAWLDPSPEKIVVAPKPWFRDPALDDSTLVPEGWVRLPADGPSGR